METGKLPTSRLIGLLDKYKGAVRPEVILAGKLGEDASYIAVGDQTLVLSTDPVTAAKSDLGTIAFNINMNDIATSGAEGVGVLVTVLLPPDTAFTVLDTIMAELHRECLAHDLQILGGHTEVTDAVTRPVVSVTAVGLVPRGEEIYSAALRAGDSLVVSKRLALEGTLILADLLGERAAAILTPDERKVVAGYRELLSVIPEGRIGKALGVHSMHDITEGGILGAVYEVALASGLGCHLEEAAFPFDDVTLKLTNELGLDPNRLISSGSMLFGTAEPEKLIAALAQAGIKGTVIGVVTEEPDYLLRQNTGELKAFLPPAKDEIYRLFQEVTHESR